VDNDNPSKMVNYAPVGISYIDCPSGRTDDDNVIVDGNMFDSLMHPWDPDLRPKIVMENELTHAVFKRYTSELCGAILTFLDVPIADSYHSGWADVDLARPSTAIYDVTCPALAPLEYIVMLDDYRCRFIMNQSTKMWVFGTVDIVAPYFYFDLPSSEITSTLATFFFLRAP
jgi:hypothetical protein